MSLVSQISALASRIGQEFAAHDERLSSIEAAPTVPTGWLRHNASNRQHVNQASIAALTSGRLSLYPIILRAGDVITKLGFVSGGTGAATPTHQWFALYDVATRSLLRQTVNDTTTAWGGGTLKSLDLTSSYTVTETGLYYVGICVVATTVPTLHGMAGIQVINGLAPVLNGTSNTGLTGTAPATANAPSAAQHTAYVLAG